VRFDISTEEAESESSLSAFISVNPKFLRGSGEKLLFMVAKLSPLPVNSML